MCTFVRFPYCRRRSRRPRRGCVRDLSALCAADLRRDISLNARLKYYTRHVSRDVNPWKTSSRTRRVNEITIFNDNDDRDATIMIIISRTGAARYQCVRYYRVAIVASGSDSEPISFDRHRARSKV